MNSFDEFKRTWVNNTGSWVRKETSNLLFVVVYPDKLQWNYSVEKQTQITCMSVSGGPTGAGTGHIVKLCYQSELYDCLKASTASHAMIVSVGIYIVCALFLAETLGNSGLWISLSIFFGLRALSLFFYLTRIYQRIT